MWTTVYVYADGTCRVARLAHQPWGVRHRASSGWGKIVDLPSLIVHKWLSASSPLGLRTTVYIIDVHKYAIDG